MYAIALTCLIPAILTAALTPWAIRVALRRGVVDVPDARKTHATPIPRVGGTPIFASTLPLFAVALYVAGAARWLDLRLGGIIIGATVVFMTGLWDDIRGLSARRKLLLQSAAATIVCAAGVRVTALSHGNGGEIVLGALGVPLSILWIVGVTNAINLIDGLDGLAAGISTIACLTITAVALAAGEPMIALLTAFCAASLLAFLLFNFHPARVFLGDSGSLYVGFVIGCTSLICAEESAGVAGWGLPLAALGVPILDTALCMLRRFIERRSIFAPDCSHFHHRLLAMGLSHRRAVLTAYGLTLGALGFAAGMFPLSGMAPILVPVLVFLGLGEVFHRVGAIRLRETVEGFGRNWRIAQQVRREIHSFENVELHFRRAYAFGQWWQAVCLAAKSLRFSQLSMPVRNRDGSVRQLMWRNPAQEGGVGEPLSLTVPVPDRRGGYGLRIEVRINEGGSLEAAGRRAALFARLMEQYPPALLPSATHEEFHDVLCEFLVMPRREDGAPMTVCTAV